MMIPKDAPIEIVDYDSSWPDLFETERRLLEQTLSAWLIAPIEHAGSTSVPGLAAKPVIDIMAPVESLVASQESIQVLSRIGYLYAPYRSDLIHWFCKPSPSFRTHHLHLVPYQSALWKEHLIFRDGLRSDPAMARDYADLKRRLAVIHTADREAYTAAKGPFIAQILQRIHPAGQDAQPNL